MWFLQQVCFWLFLLLCVERKMGWKCLKAERRKNEKRRNSRVIDAFRSRLLENLPFGFAAPSVSLKAQKNRREKIITVITSRFCHRHYVSRLACAQQYQTSDPWMCLFVHTEGSAQHEHQLTGKQRGSTCTTTASLIYRCNLLYAQGENTAPLKQKGPVYTK